MRDILAELHQTLSQQRPCVWCTVVETRGSTPQKAGAAMLVYPDGTQAGTLGGGCVEAEVKRQALRTLAGNEASPPQVFSFNLDDNYGWDDGLICGGRMNILADPLAQRSATEYFHRFHEIVDQGRGCTEAVVSQAEVADAPVGSRYLFDESGSLLEHLGPLPAPAKLTQNLLPLAQRPRPYQKDGVAYLPVLPRITLFIVGGGHVGQAVAKLASDVDFDIWVLDDRAVYASPQRFPTARKHLVGDIGQTLRDLTPTIHAGIYALIVTRGHAHDEEALYHLASTQAGYVGMIGSKRKIRLIFEDLIARGIPADALERVYAPLGFAIGSQTVPEIAVSIVAELIARRNLGRTIPEARVKVKL